MEFIYYQFHYMLIVFSLSPSKMYILFMNNVPKQDISLGLDSQMFGTFAHKVENRVKFQVYLLQV